MISSEFLDVVITTLKETSLVDSAKELDGYMHGSYFKPIFHGDRGSMINIYIKSLTEIKRIIDSGHSLSDYNILDKDVVSLVNMSNELIL